MSDKKTRSAFSRNLIPASDRRASQRVINNDPLKSSTFLLPVSQKEWLDDLAYTAKKTGKVRITKASIVRFLLQAAQERGLDLTGVASDEEAQDRIDALFK